MNSEERFNKEISEAIEIIQSSAYTTKYFDEIMQLNDSITDLETEALSEFLTAFAKRQRQRAIEEFKSQN